MVYVFMENNHTAILYSIRGNIILIFCILLEGTFLVKNVHWIQIDSNGKLWFYVLGYHVKGTKYPLRVLNILFWCVGIFCPVGVYVQFKRIKNSYSIRYHTIIQDNFYFFLWKNNEFQDGRWTPSWIWGARSTKKWK